MIGRRGYWLVVVSGVGPVCQVRCQRYNVRLSPPVLLCVQEHIDEVVDEHVDLPLFDWGWYD